jgi:hypothetical protein
MKLRVSIFVDIINPEAPPGYPMTQRAFKRVAELDYLDQDRKPFYEAVKQHVDYVLKYVKAFMST